MGRKFFLGQNAGINFRESGGQIFHVRTDGPEGFYFLPDIIFRIENVFRILSDSFTKLLHRGFFSGRNFFAQNFFRLPPRQALPPRQPPTAARRAGRTSKAFLWPPKNIRFAIKK